MSSAPQSMLELAHQQANITRLAAIYAAGNQAPLRKLGLHGVGTRGGDYVASDLATAVNHATITGDAVEQYRSCTDPQSIIAFCATVAHAQHVVSGDLDVPAVGCVILLQPTKSLVLHRKQIGRGIGVGPGNTAPIVDEVGNTLAHGLPETEIAWILAGVEKARREAPVWRCDACGAANSNSTRVCQACGTMRSAGAGCHRVILTATRDLAPISAKRLAAVRAMSERQMLATAFSEAELREFDRPHGYRPGWVRRRLREQAGGGAV